MKTVITFTLILSSLFLGAAQADSFFGLWGAGISNRDGLHSERDQPSQIAPFIMGGYGGVSIEANRAAYSLYKDGVWFGSVVAQLRSHMSLDKNAAKKLGTTERKSSLDAGLAIGRRLPNGFVSRLTVLNDISQVHKGHEIDLQLYRHDNIGSVQVLSAIGWQMQSDILSNYYFGSTNYQVKSSNAIEFESIATYRQNHIGYFAGFRFYRFSDEITKSPIIDNQTLLQIFAGIGYQF